MATSDPSCGDGGGVDERIRAGVLVKGNKE